MQPPRRRRPQPQFDEARTYEYPQHLRDAIDNLPAAPGVYTFHGEEGDLPLYIGKSVSIRSRVLSHLRSPDEARMLRQTRRISHICTAGEIGALLLEASMIKQQQPLMNQKLRRNRQLCSLQWIDGLPAVVYSKDVNFATAPGLYGLFSSQRAALQALRDIADQHKLCYAALGLEKLPKGKPCFRAMIQRCAGVCRGDETAQAHHDRLQGALNDMQVACWPFPGAVGLVERHGDACQVHVVRNWTYLGSVSDVSQARALDSMAAGFDADGYKILCRPILTNAVELVVL